jgi:D-inositol-3-phosphate glycosyltransferase
MEGSPMMRIAMLSYHTCPLATLGGKDTGGMNVYVRDLTRELGRLGIHVDVFTRSQDEHVPHVLHDLGFGNRVVHIPAGPERPLRRPELVQYIPEFAARIEEFAAVRGSHYDLIHSHYWMSGIAAEQLRRAWGAPVVQMFHTLGEMKNRVALSEAEKEGAYRLDGERQVLNMADRIVAATPAEQAQLRWLYRADPAKITIIPPGVDTSHFYPIPTDEAREAAGLPKGERTILFVGRIEPLKGVDTLIQAATRLRLRDISAQHPVNLVIIGGNPDASGEDTDAEMARLQDLTRQLCMDRMVVFLGKRDQDKLPYYYSAAEVVVMPSHYESFGMVALEAMACGTPVVASQVGGLAFLVRDGETGFVVPDREPVALADRLSLLLGDTALRQRMSAQAVTYAQTFDWKKIAVQVADLYRSLISAPEPVAAGSDGTE